MQTGSAAGDAKGSAKSRLQVFFVFRVFVQYIHM
jgi:hypothetical protein